MTTPPDSAFSALVRRRRIVRAFRPDPVPLHVVEGIVRLAQHAPSAGFSQGVSFVLVTEEATRRQVAEIVGESWYVSVGHQPFVSQALVHLVLCTSEAAYRSRYAEPDKARWEAPNRVWPVPYWYSDAGCAQMLLLLAATDAGLASAFVGMRDPAALRALLGIPEHVQPLGVVLLGYPATDRRSGSVRRGRRQLEDVLHRERW